MAEEGIHVEGGVAERGGGNIATVFKESVRLRGVALLDSGTLF